MYILGVQSNIMKTLAIVVENVNVKKENALKELLWNKEQYLDSPLGEYTNLLDNYHVWCGVHTMYSEHLFRVHLNSQTNKNSNFLKGISKVKTTVFDNIDDFLSAI